MFLLQRQQYSSKIDFMFERNEVEAFDRTNIIFM